MVILVRMHRAILLSLENPWRVCGVDHRQDRHRRAMIARNMSRRCAISDSRSLQRHALECLRLEAECNELAFSVHSPSLRSHFLRMAHEWGNLADHGLNAPDA